jgi:hemoglobin-like flavoprotein
VTRNADLNKHQVASRFNRLQLFLASIAISLVVGLIVFAQNYEHRIEKGVKDLEKTVALDLQLRQLRVQYFFEAKKTDLTVMSESKVIHDYIRSFERLKNPDFETVKSHFSGTNVNAEDDFVKLYTSTIDWGESCVSHFMFYDALIVNPSGQVIFTVVRQPDFGSNLAVGPYSNTGAAQVFKNVNEHRSFFVSRFGHYAPNNNEIAVFMGSAIYEGNQYMGALIIHVRISKFEIEIGKKGALNLQRLRLHSDEVDYSFVAFDSTQNKDLITKSMPLAYFGQNGQTLAASISTANINVDPDYSIGLGAVFSLCILLVTMTGCRAYLQHANQRISTTHAMIVQSTWASIIDNPEKIGIDFYNNLFRNPQLAAIFRGLGHRPDLHKKLVSMMSLIVNHSDRMDIIEAEIAKLAGLHVGMGVKAEHIPPFIAAFIHTVEQQYDGDFSPKLKLAWLNVLNEVGKIFIQVITVEHQKMQSHAKRDVHHQPHKVIT